jgi:hypothetical protein
MDARIFPSELATLLGANPTSSAADRHSVAMYEQLGEDARRRRRIKLRATPTDHK